MEIRKLAQMYAVKNEHNIPMSLAEHEWAKKLFESSSISLTSHEAPSLIRIRSLNQHNI